MRQFLSILLFLPMFAISQTETQQKLAIRNGGGTTTTQPTRTETQQKVEIRTQNSTPNYNFGTTPKYNFGTTPNNNFDLRRPYVPYYYNRWNRWGAPFEYRSYYDFYHYDRFGYRTPARVYYKIDNTKDTILSKASKVRIGLNGSTKNKIGGWFTVGRDVYFKASFNKTVYSDQSTFYTNISMDVVRPWVINNPSQNYRLDNIKDEWSLYLGVGREFKNFGANISLGLGYENEKYQYFDGTYILSNNGRYSFKNFADNYTTLSIGLTHDYKSLSFSADFDPIRKDLYLGIGFNF